MVTIVNHKGEKREIKDHTQAEGILNHSARVKSMSWTLPENSKLEMKDGVLVSKKKKEKEATPIGDAIGDSGAGDGQIQRQEHQDI